MGWPFQRKKKINVVIHQWPGILGLSVGYIYNSRKGETCRMANILLNVLLVCQERSTRLAFLLVCIQKITLSSLVGNPATATSTVSRHSSWWFVGLPWRSYPNSVYLSLPDPILPLPLIEQPPSPNPYMPLHFFSSVSSQQLSIFIAVY